jgi:hypothetical protein
MKTLLLLTSLFLTVTAQAAPKATGQESLIELLPAKARVAAIVRRNAIVPLRDFMFSNAEMMRELQPYLERTLGLDVTRLEGIALFTTDIDKPDQHVGIILRIPAGGGALKLPQAGDAGGTPMYRVDKEVVCARTKSGLVFGNEGEVRAVVAVERGREPALSRDAGLGKLLASEAAETDFIVAVGAGVVPPDKVYGVEDAVLVYRRGVLELSLHGNPEQLKGLGGIVTAGMQMGMAQLQQEKDKATATNDPAKGASMIMAYYEAKRIAAELEPKLEGNALKMRYRMPDLSQLGGGPMMLVLAGSGAAVAVPAFQRYIKRSKTVEASMNLRKLADSVTSYADSAKKAGSIKSTDWTPKAGCCGQPGNKCVPDAKAWSVAPWKALNFSVSDPSYYQYRVRVEGKGTTTKVIVEARGDLDCDGEYSSFRRSIGYAEGAPKVESMQSDNDTE